MATGTKQKKTHLPKNMLPWPKGERKKSPGGGGGGKTHPAHPLLQTSAEFKHGNRPRENVKVEEKRITRPLPHPPFLPPCFRGNAAAYLRPGPPAPQLVPPPGAQPQRRQRGRAAVSVAQGTEHLEEKSCGVANRAPRHPTGGR